MRMFVAFLIVLAVAYFWDVEYNNGKLSDGVRISWRHPPPDLLNFQLAILPSRG
jgi:hypothetical protein